MEHEEFFEIVRIVVTLTSDEESHAFTTRVMDYLIRSHALGTPYPVPLPAGIDKDPLKAAC